MAKIALLAFAFFCCILLGYACNQPGCDAGHTSFAPDVVGPKAFRAVLRGFEYGFTGTMDGMLLNDDMDIAVRHGETSKRYEAYRLSTGQSIWKTPAKPQRYPSSAGFINLGYGYLPVIVPPGGGRTPAIVGIQFKCTLIQAGRYDDECKGLSYEAVSLDPETGTERWRTSFNTRWETWVSSPVADSEGNIYVISTDYNYSGKGFNISAISAAGAIMWNSVFPPESGYSIPVGRDSNTVPAVAESRGIVLVPHSSGVMGLDLKTGQVTWNGRNPEGIYSGGLVFVAEAADRVICTANGGTAVAAFSLATGDLAFTFPFNLYQHISNGDVYATIDPVRARMVISRWNELEARSIVDGSFLWKRILLRDTRGLAIDGQGSLYAISALSDESWIYKIDMETGTLITRIGLSRVQFTDVALSKKGLFIGCTYYVLIATEGRAASLTPQAAGSPTSTAVAPVTQNYSPAVKRLPVPVDPSSGVSSTPPAAASEGLSAGGVFGITFAASTVLAGVAGFFMFKNLNSSPGAAGYFRFG